MNEQQIVDSIRSQNNRHSEILASFVEFCLDPKCKDLRFWQALSIWCKWPFILLAKKPPVVHPEHADLMWRYEDIADPFSWEENRDPNKTLPIRTK